MTLMMMLNNNIHNNHNSNNNNNNNLQQWWENTYRHHQMKHIFDNDGDNENDNDIDDGNANQNDIHIVDEKHWITEQQQANIIMNSIHNLTMRAAAAGHHSDSAVYTVYDYDVDDDYNGGNFGNFTLMSPYDINMRAGDGTDYTDSSAIPSMLTLLFMAIAYGLVVFGGVLGNATLVLTLCSASSVRLRNPLLLAVCVADLLVTGISAPVSLLNLAMTRSRTKVLPLFVCRIMHYIQVMPVAASTMSFFMLSLDRYATVKHPRLAQLRQRRYLHVSLALCTWILSAAISTPFLFTYKVITRTMAVAIKQPSTGISSVMRTTTTTMAAMTTLLPSLIDSSNSSRSGDFDDASTPNEFSTLPPNGQHIPLLQPLLPSLLPSPSNISSTVSCMSFGANASGIFVSFIIFHTFAVFVLPGVGVLLNHYGVRQKLCALSLTARAAHGELPLPMPILRRQTHMVIVTGVAQAQAAAACGTTAADDTSNGAAGPIDDNGDGGGGVSPGAEARGYTMGGGGGSANAGGGGGDIQLHNLNPGMRTKSIPNPHSNRNYLKTSNPISPRAMREIRAHAQRQRINNAHGRGPATPGIPLPQTSTLHSRRRLANMLIASAFIFIICWTPHVFCILYRNFGYKRYCTKTSIYFNLLLGYMYSAISPVIYWALNHNTLRQSPCAPVIRLRSVQNFLRTRFRSNTVPPPPSSTNEAALGAFNPKLIKLTPKQYRAHASSHYLY